MEDISLAVGLLPIVNRLYDYLKQVQDAPAETCRALHSELESFINYAHQVDKRKQTNVPFSVEFGGQDLLHHKGAPEKLQQILKDPELVELINTVPADDTVVTSTQLDSVQDSGEPSRSKLASNDPADSESEWEIIEPMIQRFKWPFKEKEATELLQALIGSSEVLARGLQLDNTVISADTDLDIREPSEHEQAARQIMGSADSSRTKLLDWLSPLTFSRKHEEVISRHQKGTGEWFLNNKIFREWLDGSRRTLLCHGMPGAGKTTIASLVINECLKKCTNTVGVVYIYFDHSNEQNQTITNTIGAILRQLETLVTIEPALDNVYSQHHVGGGIPLSLSTMLERIRLCLAKFTTVYLILDALDECSIRVELLYEHIAGLLSSDPQMDLRILATSQPMPEVEDFFTNYNDTHLSINALDEDIRCYLEARMEHYERLQKPLCRVVEQSPEIRELLFRCICTKASGIFLVARLQIESLAHLITTENALLEWVKRVERGLDASYRLTIIRLKHQNESSWSIARNAFMWVTYARRPLTLRQLLEAIAAEPSVPFDVARMINKETLLSATGGLLQVANELSSPVEFIHLSAKEYFMRNPSIFLPESLSHNQIEMLEEEVQGRIALLCLNHMINVPKQPRDYYEYTGETEVYGSEFLRYAIEHWGSHTRHANQEHVKPVLHSLFDEDIDPAKRPLKLFFDLRPGTIYSSLRDDSSSDAVVELSSELLLSCYREGFAIGIAAIFGLRSLVWSYLESQPNINDILNNMPHSGLLLLHSVVAGELTVLEKFIQAGFDLNQPLPVKNLPALHLAVTYDRAAVVERLLRLEQVDPNILNTTGQAPPHTDPLVDSLDLYVERMSTLLIKDQGLNPSIRSHGGTFALSPLGIAISHNSSNIVAQLLAREDIDINLMQINGETPLMTAIRYCLPHLVQLIVERRDLDPNRTDENGCTALLHLCQMPTESFSDGRDLDMFRLLLTRQDLDINRPNANGTSPLHAAVAVENSGLVQALLETRTINPNQTTNSGENAFGIAVICYVDACHSEIESQDQRTAMISRRFKMVLNLLAREDLNPNLTMHEDNVPPLHWLFSNSRNETGTASTYVQDMLPFFLARTDLDVNKTDKKGRTALMLALSLDVGHKEIISLLLSRPDIDVNVADNAGRTVLIMASEFRAPELVEVVRLLLSRSDIDINKSDNDGLTALITAASKSVEVVKLLLARPDIDINKSTNTGATALMMAAVNSPESVDLLLKRPEIDVNRTDVKGRTALIKAAFRCTESLELLLARPEIDVRQADHSGFTALEMAVFNLNKSKKNIELLLAQPDIDVNHATRRGKTALMLAMLMTSSDTIAELLLSRPDIDVNQADERGRTVLMIAATKWKHNILALLLSRQDIDIHKKDNTGKTLLMIAISESPYRITEYLLDNCDIDLNETDNEGKTALDYAQEKGSEKLIALLKQKLGEA